MRKILFIDPDRNVIDRLKKQLSSMRVVWDMVFVESGSEALKLLESSSYDVLVSEMHIPDMDGVEFFDIVMKRYPGTVRIMHAENLDSERAQSPAKCTHQFLLKPCAPEVIKYTIERTCKLQDLTRNEKLNRTITGIRNLPSPPKIYDMIIKEMQSPEPSLADVGSLISKDIALSAKIIQFVNSAYFSLPRKIVDPKQATIYLGSEVVKALVLSNHVFSSFEDEAETLGFNITQLWKHSMTVGLLSGEIASTEKASKDEVEEAVIAGVLHDIGKLILLKAPEKYKEIMSVVEYTGSDFLDAEYAIMKTSHAELGAYLLGLWGIPDSIVEIVAFHHEPSTLIENVLATIHDPNVKAKDNTTPTGGILKSSSVKKFVKGLTGLAAVHAANALIIQNNCTPKTTIFPGIDMLYLEKVNLEDRLPKWVECYNKVTK